MKLLMILPALFLVSCSVSVGGGGSDVNSQSVKHSVSDNAKLEQNPNGNGYIRTLTETLDFGDSRGLANFTQDMAFRTTSSVPLRIEATHVTTCDNGAQAALNYQLFGKVKEDGIEKNVEVGIALNQETYLSSNTDYFVRLTVNFPGKCTGFNHVLKATMTLNSIGL